MIPSVSGFLDQDFVIKEQPTFTHRMDLQATHIRGYTDKQEAMQQAIYKILNTERYQYITYSWDYGIELLDLFGEPISYVVPEVERRIKDALLHDTRITSLTDFRFEYPAKRVLHVLFTAHTIFGDIPIEKAVNY